MQQVFAVSFPSQKEVVHGFLLNQRHGVLRKKSWGANSKKSRKIIMINAMSRSSLRGKPRKTSVGSVKSVAPNTNFSLESSIKEIFSNIFGDITNQKKEVQINATMVMGKKNILRETDFGAGLVDDAADFFGQKVSLQLVSVEIDPETGNDKMSNKVEVKNWNRSVDKIKQSDIECKFQFKVDRRFGLPGAFIVENHHDNEFYLKSLTLEMPNKSIIRFPCNSWIYNVSKYQSERVFFSNKVYLPDETPVGLWKFREQELTTLRGDGKGERKEWDRIYDYDTYSDLGDPDQDEELSRPVLGGSKELPYPRRCRTGRRPCKKDPLSEAPVHGLADIYVPRDERFSPTKSSGFLADSIKAAAHSLVPALESFFEFSDKNDFASFYEVRKLYDEIRDFVKPTAKNNSEAPADERPFQMRLRDDANQDILDYPIPQVIADDEDAWMRDEEFARQMIAGLNPMVIQKMEVFPPESKLKPENFGTQMSAITASHIGGQLEGLTVEQALKNEKLFILDYHDIYLPYLNKINSQQGDRKAYASRTIFFYTKDHILKPLAIELSLPSPPDTSKLTLKRVFTPPKCGNTKDWLWELAKAHVRTNHAGYHQLISHWLQTHASLEPFIIATHRQLSAIHPLNPFLLPHFKNTMTINSQARKALINGNGIIEKNFSPGKYSIEMSAAIYKEYWRFDELALPKDLLKRGMATSDTTSKHQLRLVIEDYPYAHDGLEIWDSIREWVHAYINIYYKHDEAIKADSELQTWYREIKTIGHGDKQHDFGWIKLNSRQNLEEILTTIIWIASAHHAAVNFGQYAYAGYMPNSPSSTHKFVPENESDDHLRFSKNPEKYFLSALSTKQEATIVMTTLEILSTHSSDEEYLGEKVVNNWTDNKKVLVAFDKFSSRLKEIEELITQRNEDPNLKNRRGHVNVPYTLLHPSSKPGVTGMGVPNSISI